MPYLLTISLLLNFEMFLMMFIDIQKAFTYLISMSLGSLEEEEDKTASIQGTFSF
jgi:hypothetical protein